MNMRSPLWFVVAGVIGIGGVVAAGLYVWPRLDAFDMHFIRVVLPGTQIVQLDRAGPYTVYFESRAFIDGQFTQSKLPDGLRVALTSVSSDTRVTLAEPKASVTYSMNGRAGKAILGFSIAEPGRYRLAASLPSGRMGPRFVLAIGYGSAANFVYGMFRIVGVTMALAMGGLGIAGMIVLITILQREKAKRASS